VNKTILEYLVLLSEFVCFFIYLFSFKSIPIAPLDSENDQKENKAIIKDA
jgi:hypothetical protein